MTKKNITLGLLGLGTVGGGLWDLIARNQGLVANRSDVSLSIKRVLVRDPAKPRAVQVPANVLTTNPADVLDDPEIDIVVELMGGVEPAHEYIVRALKAGKNVVTANKAVLATHGADVFEAAAAKNLQVGFEASVAGGIPLIRALASGLIANRIDDLVGILNGTTNFILTRMQEDRMAYDGALRIAQERGYAEPDPTLDVNGTDAAHKLTILAELVFQTRASVTDLRIEGIESLTLADCDAAKRLGYIVKLLAVAQRGTAADGSRTDELDLRVHPAFIRLTHPLANVRNEFNAIWLKGDAVGEMLFYGKGAGAEPTASAVLADIIEVARNPKAPNIWNPAKSVAHVDYDSPSRYYLRFPIYDRPGVIGFIATELGRHGVSISHAHADLVPLAAGAAKPAKGDALGEVQVVADATPEKPLREALAVIGASPLLSGKPIAIRIFD
jgi:homoserine dehydrogenase